MTAKLSKANYQKSIFNVLIYSIVKIINLINFGFLATWDNNAGQGNRFHHP